MRFFFFAILIGLTLNASSTAVAQAAKSETPPAKEKTPASTISVSENVLEMLTKEGFFTQKFTGLEMPLARDYRFTWNDEKKTRYEFVRRASLPANMQPKKNLKVGGHPVIASVFHIKENQCEMAEFNPYTVGDCGKISSEKFDGMVADITAEIEKLMPKAKKKIEKPKKGIDHEVVTWTLPHTFCALTFSEGAYIKLEVSEKPLVKSNARNTFKSVADLKVNVKKDPDGTIWIDNIPMIDQGDKGYCAPATISRILKYYGRDIDQHQVAQEQGSKANGGTSSTQIEESFIELSSVFNLWAKPAYKFDMKEGASLIKEYNKLVDKTNKPPMNLKESNLFARYDPELLKKARLKAHKTSYVKFKKAIKTNIDAGAPMTWSLVIGIYPENGEPPRQNGGGHMRMIVGYKFDKDPSKDELIFSDTWGRGHEKKRMNLEEAFCATFGLFTVQPRARR